MSSINTPLSNKVISTKCAVLSILEESILRIQMLENAEVDLEESILMHKVCVELSNSKRYGVLIDARATVVVSKESREYGSSSANQENLFAQAIVVNTIVNRLMGNFIIQFHKPKAPTKLFSDEESALAWLREYRSK